MKVTEKKVVSISFSTTEVTQILKCVGLEKLFQLGKVEHKEIEKYSGKNVGFYHTRLDDELKDGFAMNVSFESEEEGEEKNV